MPYTFNPFMIPTFLMVGINLWAGWWVLRRERSEIMRPFRALIALTVIWGLGMGIAGSTTDDAHYLMWYRLAQTGTIPFAVFWFWLALTYTRWSWLMQGWRLAGFMAIPLLSLVLMWTNDAHSLMRVSYEIVRMPNGAVYYTAERGPFFWVYVAYAYSLILLAFGILLYAAFKNRYRRQTLTFAVAVAMPFVANVLYVFSGWDELKAYNPSLMTLLVSQVVVSWGVSRNSLLISSPITRVHVLDHMREGMVVTDLEDRIVDINRAARLLLSLNDTHLGQPLATACTVLPDLPAWYQTRPKGSISLQTQGTDHASVLEISMSPIRDAGEQVVGYVTMISDVSEKMAAIGRQETLSEQLQVALDSASLGVWQYAHADTSFQLDRTACDHFGVSYSVKGRVVWDLIEPGILPEDLVRIRHAWHAHLAAKSPLRSTFRMRTDDGTLRYLEIRGTTRFMEGTPVRTTGVVRDVTEQVAHAKALEDALETSEQAARAKSRFLANITHEIRTPLGGILGLSSLLSESGLTPAQQELNLSLLKSGEGLLEMVNTILDFSRLESQAKPVADVEFSLDATCELTLTQVMAKAVQKGLNLHYTLDPALPDVVVGDDVRLRHIILNLLGNAIKFTNRGFVRLSVRHHPGHSGLPLEISVQDSGIGIQPDRLEAIFQPFEQADGSTGRMFGGTGLGLAIVKQSVESLGGTIEVSSTPQVGSTFIVRLPLTPASSQPQRPSFAGVRVELVNASPDVRESLLPWLEAWGAVETSTLTTLWLADFTTGDKRATLSPPDRTLYLVKLASWSNLPPDAQTLSLPCGPTSMARAIERLGTLSKVEAVPRTVLVVDDNGVNQRVLRRILERQGYTVRVASSGEEALATFSASPFDAVLLDVHMPGMDGYQTARALRELERTSHHAPTPILACTAASEEEERERCVDAGMNDVVVKPINAEVLAHTLTRWLTPTGT